MYSKQGTPLHKAQFVSVRPVTNCSPVIPIDTELYVTYNWTFGDIFIITFFSSYFFLIYLHQFQDTTSNIWQQFKTSHWFPDTNLEHFKLVFAEIFPYLKI